MKKIFNIIYRILVGLLVIIACLSALSVIGLPQSFRAFVVQSGSMNPAIKVGSIVFIRPQTNYVKSDIITFRVGEDADIKNPQATITHRIVDILQENGKTSYITKGDANNSPDLTARPADLVLGKVTLTLPYLGYPVGFVKTQTGFIVLIVIPATIIVYSELLVMKTEIIRFLKKRQKKKNGKKLS